MKIFPISTNPNSKILRNINPDKVMPSLETDGTQLSGVYYSPINFKAGLNPAFIKDMQSLKNVRCPICNTKMLNKEEFKTALNDISEVVTGAGLVAFVAKYSEYINPMFNEALNTLETIVGTAPEASSESHLETLQKVLNEETDLKVQKLRDSLVSLCDNPNVSIECRKSLKYAERRLNSLQTDVARVNYDRYLTTIVRGAISEMSPRDKKYNFKQLVGIYRKEVFSENLVPLMRGDVINRTEYFCRKLLSHSVSDLRKAFHEEKATPENMLLSCSLCEATDKKFAYNAFFSKEFYYDYVYDMARRALAGELPSEPAYPIKLSQNIHNHYTRVSADLFQTDLNSLYETLGLKPKRNIDFPLVDEPGVPCAYCGQTTITHDEKRTIYNKIAGAQTLPEMLGILHSRKEVIRPRYMPVLDYSKRISSQLASMDEEKYLSVLRRFAAKDIGTEFWNSILRLNKVSTEYKLAGDDRQEISSIIKLLDSYIRNFKCNGTQLFPLLEYKSFLIEHTKIFKDRKPLSDAVWDACYEPLLDKYQLQQLLVPIDTVAQKLGSAVKAVFQTVFKRSVATIEHLDPRVKYAFSKNNPDQYKRYLRDRNANLVVACHECNVRKSSAELRAWVSNTPNVLTHFRAFLKYAKDLQKVKDLKYNVYEVARQFKNLTDRDILPID